ncbi:MAG: CsbD family protein [Pirellulaceae bacterium]
MVTKQELSGKWDSIVGSVKQKYGQITDDDLAQVEGDLNQLSGLIQQKAGQSREQVEAFLDECCGGSFMNQVNAMAENASETLRESYEQISETARQGYDYSVKTMSRRPLESVATAAGVGLLLGVMIGISIGARRERELSWRERWSR